MSEHQLEPELHSPAPRAVQRRAGHGGFITFVHLFILPHTLIGIAGIFAFAGFVVFAIFAKDVDGTVVSTSELVSRKGSRSYPTELTYTLNGRVGSTHESLNSRPEVGSTVPLRVLELGPEPFVSTREGAWFALLFAFFFVGFWNFVVGMAHWKLTFLPLRHKALVREGYIASGRITARVEGTGNKGRKWYRLSYDYVVEGLTLSGKMDVLRADFDAIAQGDAVTVMVSEQKPQHSVIYRCAPYVVV